MPGRAVRGPAAGGGVVGAAMRWEAEAAWRWAWVGPAAEREAAHGGSGGPAHGGDGDAAGPRGACDGTGLGRGGARAWRGRGRRGSEAARVGAGGAPGRGADGAGAAGESRGAAAAATPARRPRDAGGAMMGP